MNGRVVSREELLEHVWGYDYFGDSRLVDVHIRRLRMKIEPDPASPDLPRDRPRGRLQVGPLMRQRSLRLRLIITFGFGALVLSGLFASLTYEGVHHVLVDNSIRPTSTRATRTPRSCAAPCTPRRRTARERSSTRSSTPPTPTCSSRPTTSGSQEQRRRHRRRAHDVRSQVVARQPTEQICPCNGRHLRGGHPDPRGRDPVLRGLPASPPSSTPSAT